MLRFKKLLYSETQVSNKQMGKIKSPLDLIMKSSYRGLKEMRIDSLLKGGIYEPSLDILLNWSDMRSGFGYKLLAKISNSPSQRNGNLNHRTGLASLRHKFSITTVRESSVNNILKYTNTYRGDNDR